MLIFPPVLQPIVYKTLLMLRRQAKKGIYEVGHIPANVVTSKVT